MKFFKKKKEIKNLFACLPSSPEKLPGWGRRHEEANGRARPGVRQAAEGASGAPGNIGARTHAHTAG